MYMYIVYTMCYRAAVTYIDKSMETLYIDILKSNKIHKIYENAQDYKMIPLLKRLFIARINYHKNVLFFKV